MDRNLIRSQPGHTTSLQSGCDRGDELRGRRVGRLDRRREFRCARAVCCLALLSGPCPRRLGVTGALLQPVLNGNASRGLWNLGS